MQAELESATNGYIIRYPEGDVYVYTTFDNVLNELFGFLEEELNDEIKLDISLNFNAKE